MLSSTWRLGRSCRLHGVAWTRSVTRSAGQSYLEQKSGPSRPKAKRNKYAQHEKKIVSSTTLLDLLQRVERFGIFSEARLGHEAQLGSPKAIGSRLTDCEPYRRDLGLWLTLLEYRWVKHGDDGLIDVLYGMQQRGAPVRLLGLDETSDAIWQYFLTLALQRPDVIYTICHPHHGIGRERPDLWQEVTRFLLQHEKRQLARDVAAFLMETHFNGVTDLLHLLEFITSDSNPASIQDFCDIHTRLIKSKIYPQATSTLWTFNRSEDAFYLHDHLLAQGDLPTQFEHIEPFVRDLAVQGKAIEPFIRQLERHGIMFSGQARAVHAVEKGQSSSPTVKAFDVESRGRNTTRPRKLSDEFVARAFATTSISFDFTVHTLHFFGLIEVGPLAVREMALSSPSNNILHKRFATLAQLNIDCGSSVFVMVIRNLCKAGHFELIRDVLQSDQHHEVFEDDRTQIRLLAEYHRKRDWKQINRTLAILNRGKVGEDAQLRASNLLSQHAVFVGDWRSALMLQSNHRLKKHMPDQKSLRGKALGARLSLKFVASKVTESLAKSPINFSDESAQNPAKFLVGIFQNFVLNGIFVHPSHWQRVMFTLGDMGQHTDLISFCIWLAASISQKKITTTFQDSKSDFTTIDVKDIFVPRLQAAIIEWSLASFTSQPDFGTGSQSFNGMKLLRDLRNKFGVPMEYDEVHGAYMKRMKKYLTSKKAIKMQSMIFQHVWIMEFGRLTHRLALKLPSPKPALLAQDSQVLRKTIRDFYETYVTTKRVSVVKTRGTDATSVFALPKLKDAVAEDHDVVGYKDFFHPSWEEHEKFSKS